jgi:radical SAM protein with 4Fe4S-binding SPASM domain
MILSDKINELLNKYEIVCTIDLNQWFLLPLLERKTWLANTLRNERREEFKVNERLVFTLTDDANCGSTATDNVLVVLQRLINKLDIDISSYFVIVITHNKVDTQFLQSQNSENIPITIESIEKGRGYTYNSSDPIKVKLADLDERKSFLLSESKTFCMYPWIHLHAYPTGEAYPCCHAEMGVGQVGHCKSNTLKEIWNSPEQKKLRKDMLTETKNAACGRCYEQEESGFFSGRQSANKHHGHHIHRIQNTTEDGEYKDFEMTYWDIRFSNLCNLSCRSCGHIFSSSWYKDQVELAGPEWGENNPVVNYAGRFKTDMMSQLIQHLDYVEQIYFAGGEPLMMQEHYLILEELERRGRFDVRLIYNTNFTHVQLKDRLVFDYWKKFDSVAVGASLDAMGTRAEYIRKGTKWKVVEQNRRQMLKICPDVDFYISPTLSIMNAMHISDFHREWTDQGLIRAQDLNVNILQDPDYYRIDIAPQAYKDQLLEKWSHHLAWLRPLDRLNRATVGFEGASEYLRTDNTHLIEKFWAKTNQLDGIRNENILDAIPELGALK